MRPALLFSPATAASAEPGFGFSVAASSVAHAQRASLGRGLAFVLVLAASFLASVYIPLACDGPDWKQGTAVVRASALR